MHFPFAEVPVHERHSFFSEVTGAPVVNAEDDDSFLSGIKRGEEGE
jgi:hypothetical protein